MGCSRLTKTETEIEKNQNQIPRTIGRKPRTDPSPTCAYKC